MAFLISSSEPLNTHAADEVGLRIRATPETLRVNEQIIFTLDHYFDNVGWRFLSGRYGYIVLKKDGTEVVINFQAGRSTASINKSYTPTSTGSWTAQAFECSPQGQPCDSQGAFIGGESNIIGFIVNPAVSGPPSITISVDPTTVNAGAEVGIFSTVNNLLPFSSLGIKWKKGTNLFGTGTTTDGYGNFSGQFSAPDTVGNWEVWITYQTNDNRISNIVPVRVREAGPPPPPPPPPTLDFRAEPADITVGESSTLIWSSENVSGCNAMPHLSWRTDGATGGENIVNPTVTTRYSLACTGDDGTIITRSVTVTVSDDGRVIQRYACNSDNQCVADPDGAYTSSDCDNECRSDADDDNDGGGVGPIGGLVPCGRSQNDRSTPEDERRPCGTCDIFILGSRVINFVLFTVTPAIAILLFLIAGFMILLGGANPGLINSGKNIFRTTVYGLLLVFGAWMITNTILKSLAGNYFDNQSDPWNRVVCREPGAVVPPPPPPIEGACSLEPLALVTDSAALAMENGETVVWTSSDPNVQRNLTKLQQEFNKLQNLMVTQVGGSATVNSAYRPYAYQFHLFDIYMASQVYLGNQAFYDGQSVCSSVVADLKAEQQKHGVCSGSGPCLVATPSKCAPHVKGIGVDISISPASFLNTAINIFLQANSVDLRWQALPNDRVHFNLVNPPFTGCAS